MRSKLSQEVQNPTPQPSLASRELCFRNSVAFLKLQRGFGKRQADQAEEAPLVLVLGSSH